MRYLKILAAISVLSLLGTVGALATPITILNNSFESPSLVSGAWNYGPVTSWDPTGAYGVWNIGASAPDSNQVAWLHTGSLAQVLTDSLQLNTTYTLTFYADNASSSLRSMSVELWAGSTQLASSLITPAYNVFGTYSLQYTSTGSDPIGSPLQVRFDSSGSGTEIDLDNVTLTADDPVVPEPTSLLLLGTGLAALGLAAHSRKK